MAATASIIINVDDSGAVAALSGLEAAGAKAGAGINQGLAPIAPQLGKITESTTKGREAAALLSEELGVRMPRALRNVLAESSTIGPALSAAFSGVAVASFVAVAAESLIDLLGKIYEFRNAARLAMLDLQKKAVEESISMLEAAQAQSREIRVKTETAGANELLKLQAQYLAEREKLVEAEIKAEMKARITGDYGAANLANQNVLALDKEYAAEKKALLVKESDDIRLAKDEEVAATKTGRDRILADEKTALDQIKAQVREGSMLRQVAEAERARIHAQTNQKIYDMDRQALVEGVQAKMQARASGAKGELQIELELEAQIQRIFEQEIKDGTHLDDQRVAARMEADNKLRDLRIKNAEDVQRAEEDAAVAMLPPWERSYAQINVDTQKRLREIQQALKDTTITADDAARLSAAAWAEQFAKTRDQLANDLESLFNDITSGNIGKRFKDMFKKLVFEMVATWILGMNQMRAASQQTMTGGGGILGAIFGSLGLGGIFGGGAGSLGTIGSPGVIMNFGESGLDNLPTSLTGGGTAMALAGLGPSAGFGAGLAGGTMPAGSGPAGMIGGPLGSILGKIFPNGLGPLSGSALATIGIGLLASTFRGGGILNALGGAAGGALTGFAIAGPIGAIIGGIAGFLTGIFGHSTRKARLQIEHQIKDQAQAIENAYDLYQVDWSSATSQLEQLRQQGVDALKQAGVKDINRSRVVHVDQWIDKAEKEINALQKERDIRGAMVFGPAQFRRGGFVDGGLSSFAPTGFRAGAMPFAVGGEVPAILHAGEFVMRPEAVAQHGVEKLNRMNSGGGGGDTYIINAVNAKSFEEMLRSGRGLDVIIKELRRAKYEGQW